MQLLSTPWLMPRQSLSCGCWPPATSPQFTDWPWSHFGQLGPPDQFVSPPSGQCEMIKSSWLSASTTQQQPSHQLVLILHPNPSTAPDTTNWLSPTWNQDTMLKVNESFSCKKCVYFIIHLCPPMWVTPSLCVTFLWLQPAPLLDFCPKQFYLLNPTPSHSSKKILTLNKLFLVSFTT